MEDASHCRAAAAKDDLVVAGARAGVCLRVFHASHAVALGDAPIAAASSQRISPPNRSLMRKCRAIKIWRETLSKRKSRPNRGRPSPLIFDF